jgi:tetratricopeptide (TPR) repeat protein
MNTCIFKRYMCLKKRIVGLMILVALNGNAVLAQVSNDLNLKKPEKYQNRALPAEKGTEKKFTVPKRLYNNTVTRFNYYFNANNRLNDIITRAKEQYKDDYTTLLSFYNYSLDETAKQQIDSIIYKCTAGILLHDLRSDWADRLYLLLGNAYMHRKDFDSAAMVFQFINYAYAPKDDGYDIPIGSNASNTNGIFSITSDERRSIWQKMSANPPARNESFLLQTRNYIEQGKTTEAAGLLELIRTDKKFPARLQTDWYEMEAYLNYKESKYDSAAWYIQKSLSNAPDKLSKARWEYLTAQLFEKIQKDSAAISWYRKSIDHTTDPVMEIYARLNIVRLLSGKEANALQENLNQILQMARKDKYAAYWDILYYTAATLEHSRKNEPAAEKLLLKSLANNDNNPTQQHKSFYLLADVYYSMKKYPAAGAYYDSVQLNYLKPEEQTIVTNRKDKLNTIIQNIAIIQREDSLQRIASLPLAERDKYILTLLKKMRKEKGIKEPTNEPNFGNPFATAAPTDLFQSTTTEFYFLNSMLKTKGLSEFQSRWGTRPNIDNWRRQSAVDRSLNVNIPLNDVATPTKANDIDTKQELSYESLFADLPTNSSQVALSNKKIKDALSENGYSFQYYLRDYAAAIACYEEIQRRFPEGGLDDKLLYQFTEALEKNNEPTKATEKRKELLSFYPNSTYTAQYNKEPVKGKTRAEQVYQDIYDLFVSGKFEEAKQRKILADKQYGKNYLTPKLLFIESIYYIKQKEDSTAINRLQQLATNFNGTEMAKKATAMIDVLNRRKEIESYLTNLQIDRPEELPTRNVELNETNTTKISAPKKDSIVAPINKQLPTTVPVITMTAPVVAPKIEQYMFNAADTQFVVVALKNVDPIYGSEGRNAFNRFNQERYYPKRIPIELSSVNDSTQYLLIGPFTNAAEATTYIDQTKPITSQRIVPWLSAEKYRFYIISSANLSLLRKKKDTGAYEAWLHSLFPDKF